MKGVIADNWQTILTDMIGQTKEINPVADALVSVYGAEEFVEGSISMAQGNIGGLGQVASGLVLSKVKAAKNIINAATDLPIIKPGSKEWSSAVNQLSDMGKGKVNIRTATASDAKTLLKEARGNMNRRKQYTNDKNKNYEVHNDQNAREVGAGNNLRHLKWKDGKAGGHIYYDKTN